MPCYDPDPEFYERELRARLDRATRVACWALAHLRGDDAMPAYVRVWQEEHRKVDEKRREQEERDKKEKEDRTRALSKLTPAERRALGVRSRW